MAQSASRRQAVHARARGEDRLLELLQMLAVRPHLEIVLELVDGEKRVTELAAAARITTVGAAQHLAKLRRAGLVARDRLEPRSSIRSMRTVSGNSAG